MTADAQTAFAKFLSCRAHHDLPWETQEKEMQEIFYAGWAANEENDKQDVLPFNGSAVLLPKYSVPAVSIKTETCVTTEDIWNAWPVGFKTARGAALPAIRKAMKKVSPSALLAYVTEYAIAIGTWPAADRQYVPMCSTWMNQERWADDRSKWLRGAAAQPSQFTNKYT